MLSKFEKRGIKGNRNHFRFKTRKIGVIAPYGGFGRQIIFQIMLEGGYVIAIGRNLKKLNELKAEYDDQIDCIECDISDEKGQKTAINGLIKYNADSLVNIAGIFKENLYTSFTRKEYKNIMNTNLVAPLFISQGIAIYWINNKIHGNIVNISSMAGISPLLGHTLYGLSKAGLDFITKQMALELAPYNIQVNSINPTIVNSEMGTGKRGYWGNKFRRKWALDRIPCGRFGEVPEIVSLTTYLLSNEARFIVGQCIQIDGGLSCGASNKEAKMILPEELDEANEKIKELERKLESFTKSKL